MNNENKERAMLGVLSYDVVDDLGLSAEQGLFNDEIPEHLFVPEDIGPVIELDKLSTVVNIPAVHKNKYVSLGKFDGFYKAFSLQKFKWICSHGKSGFIRTRWPKDNDEEATSFFFNVERIAVSQGFPKKIVANLIGAVYELQDNISLHSEARDTGIIAFQASSNCLEFIVSDEGIGILDSLRQCKDYRNLSEHGKALSLALEDGNSRYGLSANRGTGFRQIFVALASLNSSLRFRTGNSALTISGRDLDLVNARVDQKPFTKGFFVSIKTLRF